MNEPFGQVSELEALEQRYALLTRRRTVLGWVFFAALLCYLGFLFFSRGFIGGLHAPLSDEQKQFLIYWMAAFVILFVTFMGLGISYALVKWRHKRLLEELEHRRLFPR